MNLLMSRYKSIEHWEWLVCISLAEEGDVDNVSETKRKTISVGCKAIDI